jgi:two-component system response regulator HydG
MPSAPSPLRRILIVDDEPAVLRALRRALPPDEFQVDACLEPQDALRRAAAVSYDAVLLDVVLPEIDGLEVLRRLKDERPELAVVMITGQAGIRAAVTAMRLGAADVLEKPIEPAALRGALRDALSARDLGRAHRLIPGAGPAEGPGGLPGGLIGGSGRMQALFGQIAQVAPSRASVLIQGESGTGKELVARALHERSGRRGPLVAVNCPALTETLAESELFGHARGAFTGAERRHRGLFEAAQGGTLFLDEIGELPLPLQAKLLRALQEGEVRPLGQRDTVQIDARLVCATNVDLEEAVAKGRFREDLYYRLAVITLRVPPLRERLDDLPRLCLHFLRRHAPPGRTIDGLTNEAMALLLSHRFPGNVRELENLMERAAILGRDRLIRVEDLPPPLLAQARAARARAAREREAAPLLSYRRGRDLALLTFDRRYLSDLLQRTRGNVEDAARRAGLDPASLRRILRRCGLLADAFRPGAGGEPPAASPP